MTDKEFEQKAHNYQIEQQKWEIIQNNKRFFLYNLFTGILFVGIPVVLYVITVILFWKFFTTGDFANHPIAGPILDFLVWMIPYLSIIACLGTSMKKFPHFLLRHRDKKLEEAKLKKNLHAREEFLSFYQQMQENPELKSSYMDMLKNRF